MAKFPEWVEVSKGVNGRPAPRARPASFSGKAHSLPWRREVPRSSAVPAPVGLPGTPGQTTPMDSRIELSPLNTGNMAHEPAQIAFLGGLNPGPCSVLEQGAVAVEGSVTLNESAEDAHPGVQGAQMHALSAMCTRRSTAPSQEARAARSTQPQWSVDWCPAFAQRCSSNGPFQLTSSGRRRSRRECLVGRPRPL